MSANDTSGNDASAKPTAWVALARVGRPHGVRGEVKVQPFNEESTLLFTERRLRLRRKGRPPEMVEMVGARPGGALWIVKFEGVDDRDQAAALTHGELSVPRDALPALEDGEFYHADVVGSEVVDAEGGALLGKVRHIHDSPTELLEVRLSDGGDVLVPMQSDYVVEIQPGRVVVRDLDHWRA